MIARDVMTANPLTVTPDASVAEVWDLMREVDVRHVPVTLGGVLVGMLSDRDLARVDIARLLKAAGADALRQELETPIVQIMSSDVISVEADTEDRPPPRPPARPQDRSPPGDRGRDAGSARNHKLRGRAEGAPG